MLGRRKLEKAKEDADFKKGTRRTGKWKPLVKEEGKKKKGHRQVLKARCREEREVEVGL